MRNVTGMVSNIRALIGRYLAWRNDTDQIPPAAAPTEPRLLKADISKADLLKQSRGLAKTGEGGAGF